MDDKSKKLMNRCLNNLEKLFGNPPLEKINKVETALREFGDACFDAGIAVGKFMQVEEERIEKARAWEEEYNRQSQ